MQGAVLIFPTSDLSQIHVMHKWVCFDLIKEMKISTNNTYLSVDDDHIKHPNKHTHTRAEKEVSNAPGIEGITKIAYGS